MKQPAAAKGRLDISLDPAKPGFTIRLGWASEPLSRVRTKFEELWKFLEGVNMADWERVHGLATNYHPDYMRDQTTGELGAGPAKGGLVFHSMERGNFSPALLKALAPHTFAKLPRRTRGVPLVYKERTMILAACLACHEYERICTAQEDAPNDNERLARHLYWFERFSALRERIRAAPPPNLKQTAERQKRAEDWQDRLKAFRAGYVKRNGARSMRETVKQFTARADAGIGFDRAYRWASKSLK